MPEQNKEISPQEYYRLLKKLAYEGKGYGKTADVWAYPIDSIKVTTLTSDHRKETDNTIKIDPVYLSVDPKEIPEIKDKKAVINTMTDNWGKRLIGERDPKSSDYEGMGVYINKKSKFEDDYIKKANDPADANAAYTYSPNPEATRVAIILDQDTVMPASWGSNQFVAKGGSVAIRERDLAGLLKAIENIERGGATDKIILDTLYKANEKNERVAAFDAYPMEGPTDINPNGFLLENYKTKNLKESTLQMRAESLKIMTPLQSKAQAKAEVAKAPSAAILKPSDVVTPFPLDIAFFQKDEDTFESVERVIPARPDAASRSLISRLKYAVLERGQEQLPVVHTKADVFYDLLEKEGINANAYTRPRDVPPGDLPQYNATAVYTNDKGRLVIDISVKDALEKKYALNIQGPTLDHPLNRHMVSGPKPILA